ncbi:Putative glycosyl transferase CAP10 domain-containing protein [Septoria linicola]|uniref:Glycosyl transferase CAP10 domain-containing protein n=1 Tax=Septoria linicola TaxID=215465 RepID=A0A9Q9AKZ3_9PEZI|nr:Putative glycosyl transferase CAP10 domain-containing protein [Septoria linicola]
MAQLLVYIAFLPKDGQASRQLPPLASEQDVVPGDLCWKVVLVLFGAIGAQTMIFGFSSPHIVRALLVGLMKALSWFFLFRTRRHVSWCIAPAAQTFSFIAAWDPSTLPSHIHAIFNVVASVIALGQVIHMLPKRAKATLALWSFLLAPLIPYFVNTLAIRSLQSSTRESFSRVHQHPVEVLINNAKTSFNTLVQHQSKSYSETCDEYRRRYKMEPPNGFENWYTYAIEHRSPIIDDFDTIYTSVSPFWKTSGAEMLQVMTHAHANPDSELWLCELSGIEVRTRCSHPRRSFDRHIGSTFDNLLRNISVALPEIKFLVNHLDEPRTLLPPKSHRSTSRLQNGQFDITDMSRRPVWNEITKYCGSDSPDAKLLAKREVDTHVLPFVENVSSAKDLCQHPELKSMHGLLMHPTSFRLIEGQVPVLSTGSLSTMSDILYPSPAYFEAEFQYDETHDVAWERKNNNLYWAGSTTGGYAVDDQWRQYQRQRFVSLTQNLVTKQHIYLQESEGVVKRVASQFLNRRLFDVAFTKIFQCTMKHCRNQRAYFRTKPWADKYKAFRSKLAFDIDGNGISGRYYQLLASNSVPLKQTLLREWHDDRLVPWVHYIPISQSMEEVPELVAYLTYSQSGQRKAKEIAEAGRVWHAKAFREVDFSIYVYRLLLEIARLQDPDRLAKVD